MLVGLFALGGATVMLNLGPNIAVLILGRILQGISAAVVWVVGLALLADTVHESEIGQTMGYIFTAMSIAILLGPLLGGVVFDKGSYNDVYAMAYVLIGVDVALRLLMIEKKVAKKWEKVEDIHEDGVDTATMTNVNAASPTSKEETITSNNLTVPIPDSEIEITTQGSKKSKFPAVITLLKSRRLLCALWGTVVISTLMTQFDSVLPLFVKETFGWNSLGAGLIFIPLIVPSFISPVIGWAIDRYGGRYFCIAGFIGFAPFEILLRLVDHNSLRQKILLCALLVGIGFSLDLAMPPIMVEITYVVEQKEKKNPGLFGNKGAYAQAYGLFNFAWAMGCLIGPIWAGYVKDRAGWGTMAWSLALLALVTSVPAGIWTGGSIFTKGKRREQMLSEQRNGGDVEMGRRTEDGTTGEGNV
ncbi:MFS general substrate transporter [Venturia nashicola]|uniref:MFS general substrate transporter n=1 Tax=Venturia nashicola TaxID=86259 RepID=A0A4Z1PBZ8_9PEZI|nr:MFS general substrate transporter [Venturia nashicola]